MHVRIGTFEYAANFFHYFVRLSALLKNVFDGSPQTLTIPFSQIFCS